MSEMRKRLLAHLVKQGKLYLSPEKKPSHYADKHFEGEVKPAHGVKCPRCGYSLDHIPVAATGGEACPLCGYGWSDQVPRAAAHGGRMDVGHSPSGMTHGGVRHFTRSLATQHSAYARGGMVQCPHCGYGQDRAGACVRCGHHMESDMSFAQALKHRR